MTGCGSAGGGTEGSNAEGVTGLASGCFSLRMSRTVVAVPLVTIFSSRERGGPLSCLDSRRNAGLTFPSIINFAKERASFS